MSMSDSPQSPAKGKTSSKAENSGSKRGSIRILRSTDTLQDSSNVFIEEWYEELECGICSNIMGAPQSLVPCGHSFCGPCAWQWIKINNNLTCPHCRSKLHEATPFIPNIVVDQIIERKLRNLGEGSQRVSLISERTDKSSTWKLLQPPLQAASPRTPRRTFDDWTLGLFEHPETALNAHHRRASRHLPELGAPVIQQGRRTVHTFTPGGLTLGAIRRREAEEDSIYARFEGVRLLSTLDTPPRVTLREQWTLEPSSSDQASSTSPAPTAYSIRTPEGSSDASMRSTASPVPSRPENLRSLTSPLGRPTPLRSQILAARQARGRSHHDPVVVSDSEDEN